MDNGRTMVDPLEPGVDRPQLIQFRETRCSFGTRTKMPATYSARRKIGWTDEEPVLPTNRRLNGLISQIDQVRAMFPHFSDDEIRDDLSRTGSVDQTIENILSGRFVVCSSSSCKNIAPEFQSKPFPLFSSSQPQPPPSQSSTDKSGKQIKSTTMASLLKQPAPDIRPPNKWESSPEARAENLRQRKAFMLHEARKWAFGRPTERVAGCLGCSFYPSRLRSQKTSSAKGWWR